ncbi:13557_t:CDS:1 [Funneliformis geosporum]|uniref:13557_t:CDS:1 n=1 Tax=Funneliformis geosporum TaxID=1117311 RepID=A0A9W4WHJ4_9GLOM|nr:13557_t:CDS:1 [Funneliformis geosporum]
MPEELRNQMEEIKLVLERANITYIQLVDCEADDLITSFVRQNKKTDANLIFDIFTRDKDLLQLLDEKTNILKYVNGKITLYAKEDFQQEYNFPAPNFADYLSLLGDNVDNVKGVRGIGTVGAKNLIRQFQTVENIYQQKNNLPENSRKLLENCQEEVYLNKKIVGLEDNISLPTKLYEKCDFN